MEKDIHREFWRHNPAFRRLRPVLKALFEYILSEADLAGFWRPDWQTVRMMVGGDFPDDVPDQDMCQEALKPLLMFKAGEIWQVKGYFRYRYPEGATACAPNGYGLRAYRRDLKQYAQELGPEVYATAFDGDPEKLRRYAYAYCTSDHSAVQAPIPWGDGGKFPTHPAAPPPQNTQVPPPTPPGPPRGPLPGVLSTTLSKSSTPTANTTPQVLLLNQLSTAKPTPVQPETGLGLKKGHLPSAVRGGGSGEGVPPPAELAWFQAHPDKSLVGRIRQHVGEELLPRVLRLFRSDPYWKPQAWPLAALWKQVEEYKSRASAQLQGELQTAGRARDRRAVDLVLQEAGPAAAKVAQHSLATTPKSLKDLQLEIAALTMVAPEDEP